MTTLPPFTQLTNSQVATIRQYADIAEQQGNLTPEQLALIYKEQWFTMLVPTCYGGLELPLPQVVQLEEELARADGSLGWAVTLCAGAGWFGGFTDAGVSKQIFANPRACLAGSGAPTGFADVVADGYRVTGTWLHASGAQHATIFTANCIIRENGLPVTDGAGNQKILSFTFLKDEVTVLPGWPYMGMKATSSYRYTVKDVLIPRNRTFKIDAATAIVNTPLYHYPFISLAWATLAANISGMALHFAELALQLFTQKQRHGIYLADLPTIQNECNNLLTELNEARDIFFTTLNESWQEGLVNNAIAPELLERVCTDAHWLAKTARHTVDALYPYCGLAAADTSTELNRVWRDIHTAGQHSLLVFGSSK